MKYIVSPTHPPTHPPPTHPPNGGIWMSMPPTLQCAVHLNHPPPKQVCACERHLLQWTDVRIGSKWPQHGQAVYSNAACGRVPHIWLWVYRSARWSLSSHTCKPSSSKASSFAVPLHWPTQVAWLLLSFCAAPRAQSALRSVPPQDTRAYVAGHNGSVG